MMAVALGRRWIPTSRAHQDGPLGSSGFTAGQAAGTGGEARAALPRLRRLACLLASALSLPDQARRKFSYFKICAGGPDFDFEPFGPGPAQNFAAQNLSWAARIAAQL